jgi:hypothetical protein
MMIVKRGLDPELWNALVSQGVPLDNYERFKQQAILLDNQCRDMIFGTSHSNQHRPPPHRGQHRMVHYQQSMD